LITGAGKRIGAACARLLHSRGYNIILHYRSSIDEAVLLCAELNQIRPNSAVMIQADLLISAELNQLAIMACDAWGGVDVLVNNASAFYPTQLSGVTESQWDELLGSNLKAPFFLAKALSDELLKIMGP